MLAGDPESCIRWMNRHSAGTYSSWEAAHGDVANELGGRNGFASGMTPMQ
jgi:hypothetical protein